MSSFKVNSFPCWKLRTRSERKQSVRQSLASSCAQRRLHAWQISFFSSLCLCGFALLLLRKTKKKWVNWWERKWHEPIIKQQQQKRQNMCIQANSVLSVITTITSPIKVTVKNCSAVTFYFNWDGKKKYSSLFSAPTYFLVTSLVYSFFPLVLCLCWWSDSHDNKAAFPSQGLFRVLSLSPFISANWG